MNAVGCACCCGFPQLDATLDPSPESARCVRATTVVPRIAHAAAVQRKIATIASTFLVMEVKVETPCGVASPEMRKSEGKRSVGVPPPRQRLLRRRSTALSKLLTKVQSSLRNC